MNVFANLCLALASLSAAVQEPQSSDVLGRLAISAEEDLTASIAELNRLREEIAGEKLPLSQRLTAAEDELTELRREHDAVTRMVDEGNLEIARLKGGTKARQDELDYIGNLLDEYARTFESKVNVSELQHYGEAIEATKQAGEDLDLERQDRFAKQIEFVQLSIQRLSDAIGGMRFPGLGVDLEGAVARGQFALIGPVALFSAGAGGAAGLVVPQSESSYPLIRPLDGALQAGLLALVDQGEGEMPLDPTRGGALQALVQKTNLWDIFERGGPIMWPLLVASILALATVIERLFFLLTVRWKRDPSALERFFAAVGKGAIDEAIEIGKSTKFFVVRALSYALAHRETSLANALVYAQAQELKRFQRGIPILDTVITLAPLLGLLGTVTGMMASFSLIGGELSAPGAITGGIAEALIATAFGLGIAITALLPFNFLNARMEEARHEMESAATQLELMVGPAIGGSAVNGAGGSEERQRREREQQKKRLELRRQIAELQLELEDQGLERAN
jgi:biopolymer transport protein ExbB